VVEALLTTEARCVLLVVGKRGALSLTGEVGESRSREPVESFVRFFLRNPRVGIRAAVEECGRALAWPGERVARCVGGYGRRGQGIGREAVGAQGMGGEGAEGWRADAGGCQLERERGVGWRSRWVVGGGGGGGGRAPSKYRVLNGTTDKGSEGARERGSEAAEGSRALSG